MRSFANIGKKDCKIVPWRMKFYSASTVVFISFMPWVSASRAYSTPSSVEWVMFSSFVTGTPRMPVSIVGISTFTRDIIPASKSGCCRHKEVTTVTSTQPKYLAGIIFSDWLNCNQSTKTLTCDIYSSSGHRTAPTVRGSSGEIGVATVGLAAHYNINRFLC
jgi:hypothetical protein